MGRSKEWSLVERLRRWADWIKDREIVDAGFGTVTNFSDQLRQMSAIIDVCERRADNLSFSDLREANEARQAFWGGVDNWTLADWSNAAAGEMGEVCNVVKKLRRAELGTLGNEEETAAYGEQLKREIGDTLIYLDLLAKKAGATLDDCAMLAFNEKSEKLDMPVLLRPYQALPGFGGGAGDGSAATNGGI